MRSRAARPRQHRLPLLFLLAAGLLAAVTARGADGPARREHGSAGFDRTPALHASQGQLTLDQAVEMAERRFRARVVRAGVEEVNGQRVFVLRLLSEQGRVWTVRVDAQSGSII